MVNVGIWLPTDKLNELNLPSTLSNLQQSDINIKLINLDEPLENQGPFDLIVHRISHLKKSDESNKRFENFMNYITAHPETQLSENVDIQISFKHRDIQMRVNEKCVKHPDLDGRAFVPSWTFLTTNDINEAMQQLIKDNVSFPIMCKSVFAQSHASAHDMCIIFNKESIPQLKVPCIAQKFVNHNAKLIKIYTMGPFSFIFDRKSVKNLYPCDSEPLYFHTYDICKGKSSSQLTQCDVEEDYHEPDQEFLKKFGQACREYSGLEFFGADVIIDCKSGKYCLVDLNTFPSYAEIDFLHYFILYIKWRLNIP